MRTKGLMIPLMIAIKITNCLLPLLCLHSNRYKHRTSIASRSNMMDMLPFFV